MTKAKTIQTGSPARELLPKAEQARRTRKLIVDTGIRCLATHGFANTTMLQIAREANLSRGPLHYHFADRNELMSAIAEALPRRLSEGVLERLGGAHSLEERLAVIIDLAVDEHLGEHHFAAMELLLAARNDTELFAAIEPHFAQSEESIDAWWLDYLEMLRWPQPRLLAFRRVAVACLRGLALDSLLQGDVDSHRDALKLFREMLLSFAKPAVAPDAAPRKLGAPSADRDL